jgi:HSP20 family protein
MHRQRGFIPFEGGALARRLFGDFDRLFEEAGVPWFRRPNRSTETLWFPELEITEREGKLLVRVDLPGLTKEEVTVTATDEYLTIAGERKKEVEEKKNEWFHTERTYGRFARTIALPAGVKPAEIAATFENGVLEVAVPVAPVAIANEPFRIPVAGGTANKAVKAA